MMPGLAHAGHDDAARAALKQVERAVEARIELGHEPENRLRFGFEHAARQIQGLAGLRDCHGWRSLGHEMLPGDR